MPQNREAARLLVACVREHDWTQPPPGVTRLPDEPTMHELVRLAAYHRVVGCVHQSLRHLGGSGAPGWAEVEEHQRRNVAKGLFVEASLRRTLPVLDGVGVPWLVVKGPVVDQVLYSRTQLRSFSDLDVLVPGPHFQVALTAMEQAGYTLLDRNWRLLRDTLASELHLKATGGALVDFHWHLLFGRRLRETFRFPVLDMVERSRRVTLAAGDVSTFDPSDTLLHLALHAANEGGDKLVWLKDLDQSVRNDKPEWDAVVERARDWGMRLPVGVMLARAATVIGTPVPRDVLRALMPERSWQGLLGAADRLFPAQRSTGRGTPATLLARSARADLRSSLGTAGGGLATRAKLLARHGRLERLDVRSDATNPGSLKYAAGGASERAEFLAEVARRR